MRENPECDTSYTLFINMSLFIHKAKFKDACGRAGLKQARAMNIPEKRTSSCYISPDVKKGIV